MFYLDRKAKFTLGFSFIAILCLMCYGIGYIHGTTKNVPKPTKTQQEDTTQPPKDTRLGISAETFVPNFNAYSGSYSGGVYISATNSANYQDFLEFVNNTSSVIIIGKGNPSNLDSIGVIFPKNNSRAYDEGITAIKATISAVSPSTSDSTRHDIVWHLGLTEDINNRYDMKMSEYNGKRYVVSYEGNKVMFSAMTIPQ